MEDLRQQSLAIEAAYRQRSDEDYMLFVRGLMIPSATGKRLFHSCMAEFQEKGFQVIGHSLQALRDGKVPQKRRFWLERTKGAGKTLIWPAR